jgi:uncharacterized membrane protein (UPF0127 family)
LALALGLCGPTQACAREAATAPRAQTQTDVTARDYRAPTLRHAQLFLPDAFGKLHSVSVEIAESEAARERGLMWREQLPDGQGMLFVFPAASQHSFWMANTLISLDMVFLDDEWKVVGTLEALPPGSREPRGVSQPSRYVLEVPAGWLSRSGITVGAVARPDGV